MISDEKIRQIRKSVSRGEPEGEIRESLIREGYSQEDIDEAFAPHKYDMRSWYFVFACILLLAGLLAYAKSGSLLLFVFSALLFVQYYRENERLKRQ
jgi:hypothetical protein